MRRPLFGNGIPVLAAAAAAVEVFNTNDFDPPREQHVYALTVFVWGDTPAVALPGTDDIVATAGVITSGSTLALTAAYTAAQLDALRSPNTGAVKLIDKLVVRGDQQVGIAVGDNMHVFGYFERDGEHPVASNFRPLQPVNPASPFSAPNAVVLVPAAATSQVDVHRLDPDYIDMVELFVSANNINEALPAGASAGLIFPGGITLPIEVEPGLPGALKSSKILDGIPMRAPSSADALIRLTVTGAAGSLSSGTAIGRFVRG